VSAGHTPGPWLHDAQDDWRDICQTTGIGRHVIACVTPSVGGVGEETDRANARLIAAAPELLDALSDLATAMEAVLAKPGDETRRPHAAHYAKLARAAIAKATGNA
jgi:hypothetical protein